MGDALERLVALSATEVKGYTKANGTKVSAHTRKQFKTATIDASALKKNDFLVLGNTIRRVLSAKHGNDGNSTITTVDPKGQKQTQKVHSATKFQKIILGLLAALIAFGVAAQTANAFMQDGGYHEPASSMSSTDHGGGGSNTGDHHEGGGTHPKKEEHHEHKHPEHTEGYEPDADGHNAPYSVFAPIESIGPKSKIVIQKRKKGKAKSKIVNKV